MKQQNKKSNNEYLQQDFFYNIQYHNAANKALAHCPRRIDKYELDKLASTRTYKKGHLTLVIKDGGKPLSGSGHKLLDYIMIQLSKKNELMTIDSKILPNTSVIIDFDEMAKIFGKDDKQAKYRLKKQVVEDLERLFQLEVNWQNEAKRDVYRGRIISGYKPFEDDQRNIFINFTQEYVSYSMRYIMKFNQQLFQISDKYPNDYMIGRKILEHYFSVQMKNSGTNDRLAVTTLLEAAPDIPSEFEVKKNHKRMYRELIIKPFEAIMERLVEKGVIQEWYYTWGNSKELTDSEHAEFDWYDFKNFYVHFVIPEPESKLEE